MKRGVLVALLIGISTLTSACSHTTATQTRTTVQSSEPAGAEHTETTTTTTETKDEGGGCGGLLSCTVHGIGWVIALPFKAVGALITAIF